MKVLTAFYIINATLLVLHEIESAFEKEWELLKLPVKLTGFLLLHVPILLLFFWGLLEIDRSSARGLVIGVVTGASGLAPLLVHKVLLYRKGRFDLAVSNLIIFLNAATGLVTLILSAQEL